MKWVRVITEPYPGYVEQRGRSRRHLVLVCQVVQYPETEHGIMTAGEKSKDARNWSGTFVREEV